MRVTGLRMRLMPDSWQLVTDEVDARLVAMRVTGYGWLMPTHGNACHWLRMRLMPDTWQRVSLVTEEVDATRGNACHWLRMRLMPDSWQHCHWLRMGLMRLVATRVTGYG
ncbi:hypothetical protein CEXT_699281 [Caerostris extrusa]|uniref:Uncharacterized protein n=1 Tax=Caerostris extrusa TaxID=172846 RepID=A0AAV4MAU0_CAEEX|nr:hypothetical protein CEXT_699281 [Caerostris extrusa]